MAAVQRLVTFADVHDVHDGVVGRDRVSVSARHEAELDDGSRILLLDDRGWGSSARWTETTLDDIRETTRVVVGPDEPFEDRSAEAMAADHWARLNGILRRHGVVVDVTELRRLPHDVELSTRLHTRLSRDPDTP
jgi:hypothetical protein